MKSVQSKNKAKIRKIDSKYTKQGIADRKAKQKKALKIGAAVAGTLLIAGVGAYAVSKISKNNYYHNMDKAYLSSKLSTVYFGKMNDAKFAKENYTTKARTAKTESSKNFNLNRASSASLDERNYRDQSNRFDKLETAYLTEADKTLYGRYRKRH